MDARIVKVCSMGLKLNHLGKTIQELYSYFISLVTTDFLNKLLQRDKFQFNVCGEGGEYESAVFDCPIFPNKRIKLIESEVVNHSDNEIGLVAYLKFTKLELEEKDEDT